MKKYLTIILIFLAVILTPILISQLIRIPTGQFTIGDENAWVSYFGSYSGGIIGGIVAFVIARNQTKKTERKYLKEKLENEKNVLSRVAFELMRINDEFKELYWIHEKEKERGSEYPLAGYRIRKINKSNLENLSMISNEDLQFEIMKLTDIYNQIAIDLESDILDMQLTLDRITTQIEKGTNGNKDLELRELQIRKENEIIICKKSRKFHWGQFLIAKDIVPVLKEQVIEEKVKIKYKHIS